MYAFQSALLSTFRGLSVIEIVNRKFAAFDTNKWVHKANLFIYWVSDNSLVYETFVVMGELQWGFSVCLLG